MSKLVIEKTSNIDLEPTWEEIEAAAARKAAAGAAIKTYSEWVDLCCMVENHLRRDKGLI
jgi:hypothetical protein